MIYPDRQPVSPQTAVIKESLRLTRLVSSRSPLISPDEPLHYDTWTIPAKVSPDSTHSPRTAFCRT